MSPAARAFRFLVSWSSGRQVAVDGGLLSPPLAPGTSTVTRNADNHCPRQPISPLESREHDAFHCARRRPTVALGRNENHRRRWRRLPEGWTSGGGHGTPWMVSWRPVERTSTGWRLGCPGEHVAEDNSPLTPGFVSRIWCTCRAGRER